MDRLEAMRVFRRVVELESFSGAARDLQMSTASVSKQISKLEKTISVRLLNRTTRRVALTEAGARYYERAISILEEVSDAEQEARCDSTSPRGLLRVAAPMSFGMRRLGALLPGFLARYPDIEVDLRLDDRYVDLVGEKFDLGIRIGRLTQQHLVARKLGASPRVLAASPDYLDRMGRPQTPQDLTTHHGLAYSLLSDGPTWRLDGPDGVINIKVKSQLQANNGDVLASAAIGGAGIVMSPMFIIEGALRSGVLEQVLPEYSMSEAVIHAVYPEGMALAAKARVFIDYLAGAMTPVSLGGTVETGAGHNVTDAAPPYPQHTLPARP